MQKLKIRGFKEVDVSSLSHISLCEGPSEKIYIKLVPSSISSGSKRSAGNNFRRKFTNQYRCVEGQLNVAMPLKARLFDRFLFAWNALTDNCRKVRNVGRLQPPSSFKEDPLLPEQKS